MLRLKIRRSKTEWLLIGIFYIFLLQDAIAQVLPVFAYFEELFAFLGIFAIGYLAIRSGKLTVKKSSAWITMLLAIFTIVGLFSNFLYQYQQLRYVLIDVFTNLKFYLGIISGCVLFRWCDSEKNRRVLAANARFATLIFFVLLLLDLTTECFPSSGTRYGLRETQLMYSHPTYLAGAAVFLLAVMTAFYEKRNNLYICFALVVLFSTLRGKAIAGVIIYAIVFYFIIVYRKKLRFWHVVIMILAALAVAGEQFAYYYIDNVNTSARAVLTSTSFEIMRDYFPIGTGFGTFASNAAAEAYSPIYYKYGLNVIHGLSESNTSFGSDTFWPIIFGQTGVIGTIAYLGAMILLVIRVLKRRSTNIYGYATGLFILAYLLISSTSEAAFNNAIATPLAMMLGYIFTLEKDYRG